MRMGAKKNVLCVHFAQAEAAAMTQGVSLGAVGGSSQSQFASASVSKLERELKGAEEFCDR